MDRLWLTEQNTQGIVSGMNSFVPIFSKMVDSSVWEEPYNVRILWTTMLALKDSDHVVRYNPFMLRKRANMESEQEVMDCLAVLMAPDLKRLEPQPHQGRRIEKVDDGYLILNGQLYEDMMREISRKVYKARKEREYRDKKRQAESKPKMSKTPAERLFEQSDQNGHEQGTIRGVSSE